MLNLDELTELYRELRHERVLSVFLDGRTRDFSERNLWRKRLEQHVSEARKRLNGTNPEEDAAFGRALARIETGLAEFKQFLPDRGWVGFATEDRLVHGRPIRVPVQDLVRWEDGIRVAPYVRALKQDRLVVGALVDSRRVRLFEYRDGELSEPKNLLADSFAGDLTDVSISKRATGHSGVRGETATDVAQRLTGVEFERMLKQLMEVLASRVGQSGLLVIGGTHEAVAAAAHGLPASLRGRVIERPQTSLDLSEAEAREFLEAAASELNQAIQGKLLGEVIDEARSGRKGALGPEAVDRALHEGRVDTLLLSRNYIRSNPDHADHLVGVAFEHHGEVEELSVEGAERLDAEGRGVAARLRYVIEG
jgi:hypothetical protein